MAALLCIWGIPLPPIARGDSLPAQYLWLPRPHAAVPARALHIERRHASHRHRHVLSTGILALFTPGHWFPAQTVRISLHFHARRRPRWRILKSQNSSKALAARLIAQPESALRTLGSEELGITEQSFPNPRIAALSATLSTAFGAFIPIVPFFFTRGYPAIIASFVISILAHFLIGGAKTVVTGLSPSRGGGEMTIVGLGEALITYALGLIFGPVIYSDAAQPASLYGRPGPSIPPGAGMPCLPVNT